MVAVRAQRQVKLDLRMLMEVALGSPNGGRQYIVEYRRVAEPARRSSEAGP